MTGGHPAEQPGDPAGQEGELPGTTASTFKILIINKQRHVNSSFTSFSIIIPVSFT